MALVTGATICAQCPHPRAGHNDGGCRFGGCHCYGFALVRPVVPIYAAPPKMPWWKRLLGLGR